jgi:hypothetical protein
MGLFLSGSGGAVGAGGSTVASCVGHIGPGGDPLPDDLYLVVDQSSAMSAAPDGGTGSHWAVLSAAIQSFSAGSSHPTNGYSLGLEYFPKGLAPESCTADYDAPDLEVGPLPENAPQIAASLGTHGSSGGLRALGPALTGALRHMKARAPRYPGRAPVVVLITSGAPEECSPTDVAALAAAARDAATTEPMVRTAVIALDVASPTALDAIAKAGRTGRAFGLTLAGARSFTAQLGDVLWSLTTLQGCSFPLPVPSDGATLAVAGLVVSITPGDTQQTTEVPRIDVASDCALAGDAWYFDDPSRPREVRLCPDTCDRTATAHVDISICPPRIPPGQ